MSTNDSAFFSENITSINSIVSKIFIASVSLPVIFIILTLIGIFSIPISISVIMLAVLTAITTVYFYLVKFEKYPKFTMYLGLIFINLFIMVIGSHAHIGVYMMFGVPPIISCLYYNKRLSNIICIISYVCMIISLYFKFKNNAPIFNPQLEYPHLAQFLDTDSFSGEIIVKTTFLKSYIPVIMGFSIEFAFIFLITNFLSARNYRTLKRLFALIDDRNGLIDKLRENYILIEKQNKRYEVKQLELQNTEGRLIDFVAESLKSHDLLTGFHVEHTKTYVELISTKLRSQGKYTKELTDENILLFSDAAFLHDIGKIHTPEGVLNKPGKFTTAEFEMMKRHPKDGSDLIDLLPNIGDGKFNKVARDIALYHHEKWDGTGYPNKISGTEIPLCARIMTAADVLDALISLRTYKEPMPIDKAMSIFEELKGSQFEPCIVDAVIACKDEIEKIDAEFKKRESAEFYKEVEEKLKYNEILREQIKIELQSNSYSNNG